MNQPPNHSPEDLHAPAQGEMGLDPVDATTEEDDLESDDPEDDAYLLEPSEVESEEEGGEIEEVIEEDEDDDDDDSIEDELGDPEGEERLGRILEERLPMVAIVGRPNVGKSTLFNRFAGRRDALVHDKPGMTRDRRIQRVEWGKRAFLCVDTGGFDIELDDPLLEDVAQQARVAIEEADIIIMLTAVGEEHHPAEMAMFDIIRRSRKPVLLTVNKCDGPKQELEATAFYQFGFEDLYPISASHGRGVSALMEAVEEKLIAMPDAGKDYVSGGIRVAIVGRQNVGKSTLTNRLIGEDRMIASSLLSSTVGSEAWNSRDLKSRPH